MKGDRSMDIMNISSNFMRAIVSKIIKRTVKKKGYDAEIKLNEFTAKFENGEATVHMSIDATMNQKELLKLLKEVGLS
jgi:hypothetical protein